MGLFGFGKKKAAQEPCCCCSDDVKVEIPQPQIDSSDRAVESIKVLGAGCSSCHEQYEYAKAAVSNLGIDIDVEYITDLQKVVTYGVMSMPAIVVNDKVVSMGKVLKTADVEKLLHSYL